MSESRKMMQFEANKKSVGVALVLCWFLGMFGVHRFYLGASGSGAAILVLTILGVVLSVVGIGLVILVVPAFWVFIDLFLTPGMVREHNAKLIDMLT